MGNFDRAYTIQVVHFQKLKPKQSHVMPNAIVFQFFNSIMFYHQ